MTHKIWGVCVEEYAYYFNKLRQNVGLETLIWRQIVKSQTAHTKDKWPPYASEWNLPMKITCVRHWAGVLEMAEKVLVSFPTMVICTFLINAAKLIHIYYFFYEI